MVSGASKAFLNQKELSWASHIHSGYATTSELNELKTSVSNGKSAVASAITDKGVSTSATATFDTMASNIRALPDGEPTLAYVVVTADNGSVIKATAAGRSITKTVSSGSVTFNIPFYHTWSFTQTISGQSKTVSTVVSTNTTYYVDFMVGAPIFTYSGSYELVNDDNTPYTEGSVNWKIKFLTSGTLAVNVLKGAGAGIDVFLVGGGGGGGTGYNNSGAYSSGGGGGAGGKTLTVTNKSISTGSFSIVIGAGGTANTTENMVNGGGGGTSTAFGYSAAGGGGGYYGTTTSDGRPGAGGSGGSGGGGGGWCGVTGADGGSNGNVGETQSNSGAAGSGQGSTTREFGDTNSPYLYAGGGGGGAGYGSRYYAGGTGGEGGGGQGGGSGTDTTAGTPNTGGGGGGGGGRLSVPAIGGSGIVIIRNKR